MIFLLITSIIVYTRCNFLEYYKLTGASGAGVEEILEGGP